ELTSELGREDAHEAGQADQVDAVEFEQVTQPRLEDRPVFPWHVGGGDAGRRSLGEGPSARLVGYHEFDRAKAVALRREGRNWCGRVGPPPRGEHRDACGPVEREVRPLPLAGVTLEARNRHGGVGGDLVAPGDSRYHARR